MAYKEENESDERLEIPKDAFWQVKYKIRTIDEWRKSVNEDRAKLEERIRELEDWKIEQHGRLRDFIKWVSILVAAISAAINVLGHISFKP
jgi:hypothetical protein